MDNEVLLGDASGINTRVRADDVELQFLAAFVQLLMKKNELLGRALRIPRAARAGLDPRPRSNEVCLFFREVANNTNRCFQANDILA